MLLTHAAIAGVSALIAFLVFSSVASFALPARSDDIGYDGGLDAVNVRGSVGSSVRSEESYSSSISARGSRSVSAPLPGSRGSSRVWRQQQGVQKEPLLIPSAHSVQGGSSSTITTTSFSVPDDVNFAESLAHDDVTALHTTDSVRTVLSCVHEELSSKNDFEDMLNQDSSRGLSSSCVLSSHGLTSGGLMSTSIDFKDPTLAHPRESYQMIEDDGRGSTPSFCYANDRTSGPIGLPGGNSKLSVPGVMDGARSSASELEGQRVIGQITTIGGNRRTEAEVFRGASPELRLALRRAQESQRGKG